MHTHAIETNKKQCDLTRRVARYGSASAEYTSNNFNKCANLDAFWADWYECVESGSAGGSTVYVVY
jgi:hypothetical protein